MIKSCHRGCFIPFHPYSPFKGCDFADGSAILITKKKEASNMEQIAIGKFIAKKRKEQNLTQEQLAERLGVSNKTVSKWETGKCMPDYAVVKSLCKELKISVSELMDGEEAEEKSVRIYDEEQMLDLLRRMQESEKQRKVLTGVLLIVMGIAFQALSHTIGGSDVKNFFAGLLLGMSVAEMLIGVYVTAKGASGK